jgi:hypothetical protein
MRLSIATRRSRRSRRALVFAAVPALIAAALIATTASGASAAPAPWTPKTPPMTTPWTNSVPTTVPLPEYPRPQLTRSDWLNLNGIWDFQVTASSVTSPPTSFSEQIRVPFVAESSLSGIQRAITQNNKLWYQRTFTVPAGWSGRNTQLNFGGVDWQTDVWVNGTHVGATHKGGFDAFSFDITSQLHSGSNTLTVGAWDPTDAGGQAVGKQRLQSVLPHSGGGIFYTPASGIWQTVWLEPTASARITRLDLTPNLGNSTLRVKALGAGIYGQTVTATVSSGGTVVGSASGAVGSEFSVPVPNPHLWSPNDPFLYDVKVDLKSGATVVDSVGSYAGMRSIGVASINGKSRTVLNGQFLFQSGPLDQGYWPDGIYTAPTDDALKFDLQAEKNLGFNMVRKHIKVEPQRWFYWADKLGLLVWQDMPAMAKSPAAADRTQWEAEYHAVIDQHRSSPSLVTWVDQNEGWGQYDQARIANEVKAYDPSRLVDNMSGINCCGAVDGGNGDLLDNHIYVGPGNTLPSGPRAGVLGEFGGLGWKVSGHEWFPGGGFSYEDQASAAALNNRVNGLYEQLRSGAQRGLSASVYTEITDVENEANGLLTYDRQVYKVDVPRFKATNQALTSTTLTAMPTLATNVYKSLRVTNPGLTDRYIRHQASLGYTEVVNAGSSALLKEDATWRVVPGLADSSCYSFESRNYPGDYLRHQAFRVRKDTGNGTALFNADATWCPEPGSGGVRLTAYGFPGQYLRHINAELWLATPGGNNTWDNPSNFTADTIWSVDSPWAP